MSHSGDSSSTILGATSSGAGSVIGSSPGNALARIALRVGPGLYRFTRARGAGTHEYGAARIGSAQQGIEGANEPPVRGDVHRERFVPNLRREMRERRHRAQRTRVTEKRVHAPEAFEQRPAQPVDA